MVVRTMVLVATTVTRSDEARAARAEVSVEAGQLVTLAAQDVTVTTSVLWTVRVV